MEHRFQIYDDPFVFSVVLVKYFESKDLTSAQQLSSVFPAIVETPISL